AVTSAQAVTLIDSGNAPGTVVNGAVGNKARLNVGDQLQIGQTIVVRESVQPVAVQVAPAGCPTVAMAVAPMGNPFAGQPAAAPAPGANPFAAAAAAAPPGYGAPGAAPSFNATVQGPGFAQQGYGQQGYGQVPQAAQAPAAPTQQY